MRADCWLNGFWKIKASRITPGDEPEHSIRLGTNTDSYNFFLMCVSTVELQLTERVTGAFKAMELNQQYSEGCVQANTLSCYIAIDAWSEAAGIKAK